MYIDIHTHFPKIANDIFSIQNIIAGIDNIPAQNPFSIGIHPWYSDNATFLKIVTENISKPNCFALGECGLDLIPERLNHNPLEQQIELFVKQIALSEQYQKPVIIHCVKCFDKLLQLKKQLKPKQVWIIHAFQKNESLARQLIKAGFYLSFGASLFNSKTNQKALQNTALGKIFLETDDQQNYDIKAIYKQAADLLNMPITKLQQQIEENFNKIINYF